MRYRQFLIQYSEKYGVTKVAIKYKTNRQYIYRWMRRYDGTLESLADLLHRPHLHPNQHTPEEFALIANNKKAQSECRTGRVLGKADAAGILTLHYMTISRSYKERLDGGKAAKPQVHSQTLRSYGLPRPMGSS